MKALFIALALALLIATGAQAETFTLNGRTYDSNSFKGYGYTQVFPTPLLPDMLAEISHHLFSWKGAYDANTAYKASDVVSYNGAVYVCMSDVTGVSPDNTYAWNLMIQGGGGSSGTLPQSKDCSLLGSGYHVVKYDATTGLYTCSADATSGGSTDLNALHILNNLSDVNNTSTALSNLGGQPVAAKGQPGGYAGLDSSGKIPATQLPIGTTSGTVAAGGSYVLQSTTVNGHPLSTNVNVSKSDVGLGSVLNTPQEPALGNPAVNGYCLQSTSTGTRSWGTCGSGSGAVTSVNGATGAITTSQLGAYYPGGGDVAISDGGTGASTATGALTNLGAAPSASPTFTGTVTAPVYTSNAADGAHIGNVSNSGAPTYSSPAAGDFSFNRGTGLPLWYTGTVWSAIFESSLGNPSTNGYCLQSTTSGVRSWGACGTGGGGSGTVNSGAQYHLASYPSAGTTVGDSSIITDSGGDYMKTVKQNGYADLALFRSDYGTEDFGVGLVGPHSASGMGSNYFLQFPTTAPTSGQTFSFGTPTTVTYNGTSTPIIPVTWGSASTSYSFYYSLYNSGGGIVTLTNDTQTPGNSMYYGTNSSGTRGWYSLPSSSFSGGTLTSKLTLMTGAGTAPLNIPATSSAPSSLVAGDFWFYSNGSVILPSFSPSTGSSAWIPKVISLPGTATIASLDSSGTIAAVTLGTGLSLNTGTLSAAPVITPISGTVGFSATTTYAVCTANCTLSVPSPAAGNQICVKNYPGGNYTITINGNTGAYYAKPDNSGFGTSGGSLTATASYANSVCLVGYDATHYLVYPSGGTWTAN